MSHEELLNFTPRAQEVLTLACVEADQHQQPRVGTEHLLAALLQPETSIAGSVLHRLGVSLDQVRQQIEVIDRRGSGAPPDDKSSYSLRANLALQQATREAVRDNQTYVGTQHILLALLQDPDGTATRILQKLQVDLQLCRRELLREFNADSERPETPSSALAPPAISMPTPDREKSSGGFFARLFGLLGKRGSHRGQDSPGVRCLPPFDEALTSFTPRAQTALQFAHQEAIRLGHQFIGTEHLLLGLIKLRQGCGLNALEHLGLDLDLVRQEVEQELTRGSGGQSSDHMPYTPRVKKVLLLAAKEAKALHHTYLGTEHILLGLLIEGDGVAGRVLGKLGLTPATCRQAVLQELDPGLDSGPNGPNP